VLIYAGWAWRRRRCLCKEGKLATKPLLLIVSGLPGAGKTTLAKWLSCELHLPLIHRDGLKELLFDSLGWSDREWSRTLGRASYDLLYYVLEMHVCFGRACIVESNFDPQQASARFRALRQKCDFEPFQIQCVADSAVLVQRYRQRAFSSERHPGHTDNVSYSEFVPQFSKQHYIIEGKFDIGGTYLALDTTDIAAIDLQSVLRAIRANAGH
jgi:predicted kinase